MWPLVVPLSSWLPNPRQLLVATVQCNDAVTALVSTTNSQHVFCGTRKHEVLMYHVPSRRLIRIFQGIFLIYSKCDKAALSNLYTRYFSLSQFFSSSYKKKTLYQEIEKQSFFSIYHNTNCQVLYLSFGTC